MSVYEYTSPPTVTIDGVRVPIEGVTFDALRAADSGLAAVEVKDRAIETVKTVTVVQHHTTEVPVPVLPGNVAEFVEVLADLTRRLDTGRIYDRDLPRLTPALAELVAALDRRTTRQWRPPWER